MKNVIFGMFLLCLILTIAHAGIMTEEQANANPINPEELKNEHFRMLSVCGENKFLSAKHYVMSNLWFDQNGQYITSPFSILIQEHHVSYYQKIDKKQSLIIASAHTKNSWTITNYLAYDKKLHIIKYTLNLQQEPTMGFDVRVDEETSTLKISNKKVMECVAKSCIALLDTQNSSNLVDCQMRLATPLHNVAKCIFEVELALDGLERVTTKTYYVSFGNGNNDFKYFQLENLPVAFVERHIDNKSGNITFAAITNHIQANVMKVTCMVMYTGFSWYVNGHVTVVYGAKSSSPR